MRAVARLTDLRSSHDAADVAAEQELIVRDIVRRILFDAGPHGLTDRELTIKYFANKTNPGVDLGTPRKRRSQLTRAGEVLVTTSRRKIADERVSATVWVHKDHLPINREARMRAAVLHAPKDAS